LSRLIGLSFSMKNTSQLGAVFLLMYSAYAAAQQPDRPLLEVAHQDYGTIKLANHSGKAVVGYVLVATFKGQDGERLSRIPAIGPPPWTQAVSA
jgi:hypothetical protein